MPSHTILRRYVPGVGLDEPIVWYEGSGVSDARWLLADRKGSVVGVATPAGSTSAINTYDEYGLPGSSNAGRFQYNGQPWVPEAGLYHARARSYSPTLGRFMQTDPIGYSGGANLYGFVGGDPVNGADPSGLRLKTDEDYLPAADGFLTTALYANIGGEYNVGDSSVGGLSGTGYTNSGAPEPEGGYLEPAGTTTVGANGQPSVTIAPWVTGLKNSGVLGQVVGSVIESAQYRSAGYVLVYRLSGGPAPVLGNVGSCGAGACWSQQDIPVVSGYNLKVARNMLSVAPAWNTFEDLAKGWTQGSNILYSRPALPVTFNGIRYHGGGNETSIANPQQIVGLSVSRVNWW